MIILYTTCPTKKEAEKIARALMKERLVACVNIWPIHSIYWWEKQIEEASEWAMLIKTRDALGDKVESRIRALHSYQLTVIEQWPVKRAYKGTLKWIDEVIRV